MLPALLASLFCLLCLPPHAAYATTSELDALRKAGTPRLALSIIDVEQPTLATDRTGWLEWERARLELLRELEQWAAIEARVAVHPNGLPRHFTDLSRTLQAEAALATGDAAIARARLRSLVWQGSEPAPENLQRWRELLIHAYLRDDLTEDAHLAMLRYRQDYGDSDSALRVLGARILLRAGRPAAALAALGDAADPVADALRLLAELRAGRTPADQVGEAAMKQAGVLADDPLGATRYWAVAVAAATLGEQGAARITGLETGLPITDLPASEAPFALTPDDLWQAYRAHGETLANRAQLLVGQDMAWFELAQARAVEEPLAARALFATLAQRARDAERRAASHAAFATLLAATPRGAMLIGRLYLEDGAPAGRVDDLPSSLRLQLADAALDSGDTATAALLYRALDTPPQEADAFAWRLRRARLLSEADAIDAGGEALLALVRTQPERAAAEIEALLPAVVDLQQAGAHAAADEVLQALLANPQDDPETHRALLLALATCREALGQPVSAARLYLHGALLPGTDADDTTGRKARHDAVGALVAAGLQDDAIALLEGLVTVTPEKARRPLEAELAQLREARR